MIIEDDDEVRRHENKASCTNRHQAGSYFNKDEVAVQDYLNDLEASPASNFPVLTASLATSQQRYTPIPSASSSSSATSSTKTHHFQYNSSSSNNGTGTLKSRHESQQAKAGPKFSHENNTIDNKTWRIHAREAGINLEFPGTTEQKSQYKEPKKEAYKNFVINPQLNLSKLVCYGPRTEKSTESEYQSRYKHPAQTPVDKFPWFAKNW